MSWLYIGINYNYDTSKDRYIHILPVLYIIPVTSSIDSRNVKLVHI